MKIRTEKMKRKVSLQNNEVKVDLSATDIIPVEDFIELYEGRVKDKQQLENNITNYKQFLENVKNYEKDEDMKLVVKLIADKEKAQKVYAIMQKKSAVEQVQIWEKALEGMNKELEDLGVMYKKLKEEGEKKNGKSN